MLVMKQVLATVALSAFALLFALVSNLYQPPMDFNLHCTVHERVASALGGGCNMTLGGIFTSITAVVLAGFVFLATFLILRIAARDAASMFSVFAVRARVRIRPVAPLHKFYYRGIANSRKFL